MTSYQYLSDPDEWKERGNGKTDGIVSSPTFSSHFPFSIKSFWTLLAWSLYGPNWRCFLSPSMSVLPLWLPLTMIRCAYCHIIQESSDLGLSHPWTSAQPLYRLHHQTYCCWKLILYSLWQSKPLGAAKMLWNPEWWTLTIACQINCLAASVSCLIYSIAVMKLNY